MSPGTAEVKEWFQKAKQDLLAAKVLLEHDPPVLEPACFHCQQAVEKILKAFLIWKSIPFEIEEASDYITIIVIRDNFKSKS